VAAVGPARAAGGHLHRPCIRRSDSCCQRTRRRRNRIQPLHRYDPCRRSGLANRGSNGLVRPGQARGRELDLAARRARRGGQRPCRLRQGHRANVVPPGRCRRLGRRDHDRRLPLRRCDTGVRRSREPHRRLECLPRSARHHPDRNADRRRNLAAATARRLSDRRPDLGGGEPRDRRAGRRAARVELRRSRWPSATSTRPFGGTARRHGRLR
jgi:hypothetical protein